MLLLSVRNAVERSRALPGRVEEIQALRARYADLAARERDVMPLVVLGLSNKQVGSRYGISEVIVKKRRGQCNAKDESRIAA